MNTVVVTHERELARYRGQWHDLVGAAAQPNPFYEPWMLLPAMRHLRAGHETLSVVLVFEGDADRRLLGLFPLARERVYRRLPLRCLSCWEYLHCFSTTPLVRRGHEPRCLSALFAWLDDASPGARLLRFPVFTGDGPLYKALMECARRDGRIVDTVDVQRRALLEAGRAGEDYLRTFVSRRHLKEFRRLWKRLGEQGELRFEAFRPGVDDLDDWTSAFLRLEQAGWKGRNGTAMACSVAESAYFNDMMRQAGAADRLLLARLTLDGEPLAMHCGFRTGAGGVAFKIAFDEAWSRFSPGLLLELRHTEHLLDHTDIEWVDSCASPDHPMIERLWKQKQVVCDFGISSRRPLAKLLARAVGLLGVLYRMARGGNRNATLPGY